MSTETLSIAAARGAYNVYFHDRIESGIGDVPASCVVHCLIDSRVASLYQDALAPLVGRAASSIRIPAAEDNKSLERTPELVRELSANGIRRDHLLVAVGGGITQDLTCFVASILFRGMDWMFLPTTLLAQADSCIGSKSSINAGATKNLVGTFFAPRAVSIATEFLKSLDGIDLRSGVGEMLKAHAIDGPATFDCIAADYEALFINPETMLAYVRRSLNIKKRLVEIDEFDRGPRNVMNYGHSFGHAIEAATDFAIPHGIAVTMGADFANFVAARLNFSTPAHFRRMHPVLRRNYRGYEDVVIPVSRVLAALGRDKKNVGGDLVLVLPNKDGIIDKIRLQPGESFANYCLEFLEEVRLRT